MSFSKYVSKRIYGVTLTTTLTPHTHTHTYTHTRTHAQPKIKSALTKLNVINIQLLTSVNPVLR